MAQRLMYACLSLPACLANPARPLRSSTARQVRCGQGLGFRGLGFAV